MNLLKVKPKTLIVGDTHGCFNEFQALLKKAKYQQQNTRLILLGDMINRGPDSLKMLEWVKTKGLESVRGNHEQAFIDGLEVGRPLSLTLQKLKKDMGKDLSLWLKWLKKLPFYIKTKDFIVVHGGLVPGQRLEDCDPHLLMNIRTWDGQGQDLKNPNHPAWHSFYKSKRLVVYGHWAEQGLKIKPNSIGLDTGCVYGGALSGLILPQRRLVQVQKIKDNCLMKKPSSCFV